MSPETAHEKHLEQRVTYRLLVTNEKHPETGKQPKAVFCTYHNGVRLHGKPKDHPDHPEILVRRSDQDEVLWTGPDPFRVAFKLGDQEVDGPFYRTEWKAAKGKDGVYRLVSGPARHGIDKSVTYKFVIIALRSEGGEDDPESEPLDPHIIIEP